MSSDFNSEEAVAGTDDGFSSGGEFSEGADAGLGSLAQSARRDRLRSTRTTLYVIGGLTVLLHVALGVMAPTIIDAQIKEQVDQLANQGEVADPESVEAVRKENLTALYLSTALFGGMGVVFIVLGMMIYRYPVLSTVLALVLYLGGQAISAAFDPTTLMRGWLIKAIIIILLLKGVQAALAYERDRKVGVV